MLEDFSDHDVEIDGTRIHAVVGGEGPPLLLLHGYPQTHLMWHRVAPALAQRHTVVAADLRGYGDSARPPSQPDHGSYSKRAMAADQVGLMRELGFGTWSVLAHDRGARVAHRMCLDHTESVERVAFLDIVPTRHVLTHVDRDLAQSYVHWFLLAQEDDLPERLIGADPGYYVRRQLGAWSSGRDTAAFDEEAVAEYVRCFSDPEVVRATCEDYRGGSLDRPRARRGRRRARPSRGVPGAGAVGGRGVRRPRLRRARRLGRLRRRPARARGQRRALPARGGPRGHARRGRGLPGRHSSGASRRLR